MEKCSAIALDGGAGVVFSNPEIEVAFAVGAGRAAYASGESVHEPGKLGQLAGAKDCEFGFDGGPGWHMSMLTEGMWSGHSCPLHLVLVSLFFLWGSRGEGQKQHQSQRQRTRVSTLHNLRLSTSSFSSLRRRERFAPC